MGVRRKLGISSRRFIVFDYLVVLCHSFVDQLRGFEDISMQIGKIKLVHDFGIFVGDLYECLLVIISQKHNQILVFQEHTLLQNLKVSFGLLQLIKFDH